MKVNQKHYFFILIIFIIVLFVVNLSSFQQVEKESFKKMAENQTKKTIGINIERRKIDGKNISIKADELDEDKANKTVTLKNSVTSIKIIDDETKIFAGIAILKNDFEDFNLSNKVKIINIKKKFTLKTENLTGEFKKGSMFSNKDVFVSINNIKIFGKGLEMLNHGEYLKIIGKAKLKIKQNDL